MVSSKLRMGDPAICIKQDKDKLFNVGDATMVNVLVDIPKPNGKQEELAMVQKKEGGFIYLPAKLFRPLTEAEQASYDAMMDEATSKYEATD